MIIGMKGMNEEKMVKPVIGDIHDEPWVDRIIVIDGGSSDDTVVELKQFPKVEVYCHKWEKWFHAQEVIQSNILLQYIPIGEIFFILDFDEQCSPELKTLLTDIDKNGMPDVSEILRTDAISGFTVCHSGSKWVLDALPSDRPVSGLPVTDYPAPSRDAMGEFTPPYYVGHA